MVLPVWPAAVSRTASVIEPTAEVGFWALLAVASSPNRAAEPRERERACENQSLGFFSSLTPVMRTESVRKGLRVHEKRSSEVQFKEKNVLHIDAGEGMHLAVSHFVTPVHFYMRVQVHVCICT